MVIFESEEAANSMSERVPGMVPDTVTLEEVEVREVVAHAYIRSRRCCGPLRRCGGLVGLQQARRRTPRSQLGCPCSKLEASPCLAGHEDRKGVLHQTHRCIAC